VKKLTGSKPRTKGSRATDDGWVFFPPETPGNFWHSISIVVVKDRSELPECIRDKEPQ
jgi:hypothetical protein